MNELIEKRIMETEVAFLDLFCEKEARDFGFSFVDKNLLDMYYHNFSFISNCHSVTNLLSILNQEKMKREEGQYEFFQFSFYTHDSLKQPFVDSTYEQSFDALYYLETNYIKEHPLLPNPHLTVRKIETEVDFKSQSALQIAQFAEASSLDFITRQNKRYQNVKLNNPHYFSIGAFKDGVLIGFLELFLHEDILKIENVLTDKQSRMIGCARSLISYAFTYALKNHVTCLYLQADEEDSPKVMYQKFGFKKLLNIYSGFIKLIK